MIDCLFCNKKLVNFDHKSYLVHYFECTKSIDHYFYCQYPVYQIDNINLIKMRLNDDILFINKINNKWKIRFIKNRCFQSPEEIAKRGYIANPEFKSTINNFELDKEYLLKLFSRQIEQYNKLQLIL